MTKLEFNKLKNKCPWFYRKKDQPRCMAQKITPLQFKHCAKKNCAIIYWKEVFDESNRDRL